MKKLNLCDADFIGYKKGKIEVIGLGYKKDGRRYYECMCYNCGNLFYQSMNNLLKMKGLGCKNCHNSYLKTHGMKDTRIMRIYAMIKQRCYNPKNTNYKHYGGRGIKVCDEWKNSFIAFMNWAMISGYKENLEIDRIDNNGDYCPENCHWITHRENQYNKRTTVYVEYEGKNYTLLELSVLLDLPISTIRSRVNRGSEICMDYHSKNLNGYLYKGKIMRASELSKIANVPAKIIRQRIEICKWGIEKAVETPLNSYNPKIQLYDYKNEKLCIAEIARRCGINRTTLQYRLDNGWSIERATTTNLKKGKSC